MTGWRPNDWNEHKTLLHGEKCDCGLCQTYETGADAMLAAIRKLGYVVIDGEIAKYEASDPDTVKPAKVK